MFTAIIIPCFNEEQRLNSPEFLSFLRDQPNTRLYLVDDGSTDSTSTLLQQIQLQVPMQTRVLLLPENQGKGCAVQNGFKAAIADGAKIVSYLDADLATPLSELQRLIELLQADVSISTIFGSRSRKLAKQRAHKQLIQRSMRRSIMGSAFSATSRKILGLPIHDPQCGAKVYRVQQPLLNAIREPFTSRWVFDLELALRLQEQIGNSAEWLREEPLNSWQDVAGSHLTTKDAVLGLKELVTLRRLHGTRHTFS